jgi:hypothetical protein
MTKKRFIPLFFALVYFVVPPSAVYLQVALSDGTAVPAVYAAPAMPAIPAVLAAPPADPAPPIVL